MEVLHGCCAGLDVHKRTIVACALWGPAGGPIEREVRTFGTMTAELEELATWLAERGCSHVAMEATGVYWKPVYNVLEGRFTLVVANAEHIHALPGRKTDVKDAEWIADLLRHGLLRASFIPNREQRELRELTRYRTALLRERASEVNRLQKTLEAANIKLAAVLTDITGVSGQRILTALLSGQSDPSTLADLAHWRVQKKRQALEHAVVGRLTGALRFVVGQQLTHLHELDRLIEQCDGEVERLTRPFEQELARLQSIPGVGQRTAQTMLAEMGTDMRRFPTPRHLAAWAGMCPGNRESAGKHRAARTRQGSPWLRGALGEAAWAASRCQGSYFGAQFRRLAARRGRKRAIVAVGHAQLITAYHLLTSDQPYCDLGPLYLDQRDHDAVRRRAVKRLEGLGFQVQLVPKVAA